MAISLAQPKMAARMATEGYSRSPKPDRLRQRSHHARQLQLYRRGVSMGGLVADAKGDLFGTTAAGGSPGEAAPAGTVFEIAKTATGYASTPTTLVSFNILYGAGPPEASLIVDANGDLFGTTINGGIDVSGAPLTGEDGTVFESSRRRPVMPSPPRSWPHSTARAALLRLAV